MRDAPWTVSSRRAVRTARMCQAALFAGALVGALGHASLAAATTHGRLDFSWHAPRGCPDRQLVLQQVEAVLEQHAGEVESAAVRGAIERSGAQWVLSLDVQVGGARRVRRLTAESCDDLGTAAAVALGLLIQPVLASGATPTDAPAAASGAGPVDTPAGPGARLPAATPPHEVDRSVELDVMTAPERAAQPLAWQLGASAVLDSSTLAGPALGASVESQLHLGAWGFGAYGLMLPARHLDVPGGSVELEHWAAGLRFCHLLWRSAWRADGCVGAELGRFVGRGSGLSLTRNEVRDPWLAPSAGLHLGWQLLPHAALLGRVEVVAPLLRETYVINASEEVHATPIVTGRAGVGLELDLL